MLNIDTKPSDNTTVKIIGEQQYAHNAYVTLGSKYSPDVSDSILTSNTQNHPETQGNHILAGNILLGMETNHKKLMA